jgi:hypothetical protein
MHNHPQQSMIRFIENIGDYYSQHFFMDDFPKKVFDKAGYVTQKKTAMETKPKIILLK